MVCFILLAFLFFIFPSFSEELEIEIEEPIDVVFSIEENEIILEDNLDLDLISINELQTNSLEIPEEQEIEIPEPPKEYDFNIGLSNLTGYSIVALNDAFIDMHIRGSLWIGNTLTSNDWCGTDDGSINHELSGTESYIYNNQSNMYFQGRTANQSKDAYKKLSAAAVESTRDYWTNIINSFPNDGEHWIYVEPDENGYVNLAKWDYQAQGSDESQEHIEKIYWTNASKVDMGGLAGHLIAPFAEVNITWCNHGGSIVGWNIITHGEAHINYWEPEFPSETPTPTIEPTPTPTIKPTATPTIEPTFSPTPEITATPTVISTEKPTPSPSPVPTIIPTPTITISPTLTPTSTPIPTEKPTEEPTREPTVKPTEKPTSTPSSTPTTEPSPTPTITVTPTIEPTTVPTIQPTDTPVVTVTPGKPSKSPRPTPAPTKTVKPTKKPTNTPRPIRKPTPTPVIIVKPTKTPILTVKPAKTPTATPTTIPTATPTNTPQQTKKPKPTEEQTNEPTVEPKITPISTIKPTITPKITPTILPTINPTNTPVPTEVLSTSTPTPKPTKTPRPTKTPGLEIEIEGTPSIPEEEPEISLTAKPTPSPTPKPTPTPIPPEIIEEIIESLPDPVPNRPDFSQFTDEELEELFDMWGYETPLYGMFQTGDEMPVEIYLLGLIGLCALIIAILLRKKT